MKVTCWYKIQNHQTFFNHIEDDWVDTIYPLPKKKEFTNQKSWINVVWIKEFKYLINGKIT